MTLASGLAGCSISTSQQYMLQYGKLISKGGKDSNFLEAGLLGEQERGLGSIKKSTWPRFLTLRLRRPLTQVLSHMADSHIDLIKHVIPLWYANVAWAKELLVRAFGLAEPRDILNREHRHFHAVPNTCWFVRPHGVGVDIFKSPDVGGIDFDFDRPDPDEWRLALFIERQVNDGQLSYAAYRELIDDEHLLKQAVSAALNGA